MRWSSSRRYIHNLLSTELPEEASVQFNHLRILKYSISTKLFGVGLSDRGIWQPEVGIGIPAIALNLYSMKLRAKLSGTIFDHKSLVRKEILRQVHSVGV